MVPNRHDYNKHNPLLVRGT